MSRWKKRWMKWSALCLLAVLVAVNGRNVDAAEYTYTVRLYAGNCGTISGGDENGAVLRISGQTVADAVDFTSAEIQPTEKYYVKGIRLAGHDNSEMVPIDRAVFTVTGDVDYVVAYGVETRRVAYTVNYLDEAGNELAPATTLYGDVGDKPVVAYQYIEHYVPQALALTKTLSANEAENIFSFTYTPGASDTVITNTTVANVTVTGDGGTATAPSDTGTAAAADANAGAQELLAGNQPTVENADGDTPAAVQDLDEETPLGNILAEDDNTPPFIVSIVVGLIAVAALLFLIVFWRRRKKTD